MKIIDYSIAQGDDAKQLLRNVKLAIGEGWQPIGGIGVLRSEVSENTIFQALVKYEIDMPIVQHDGTKGG